MTAPTLVGPKQMLDTIDRVAMSSPNRTTTSCYVLFDKPRCIGAVVLTELGVPLDVLKHLDDLGARVDEHLAAAFLPQFAPDALEVLGAAQGVNDDGGLWRAAFEAARETATRLGVI